MFTRKSINFGVFTLGLLFVGKVFIIERLLDKVISLDMRGLFYLSVNGRGFSHFFPLFRLMMVFFMEIVYFFC